MKVSQDEYLYVPMSQNNRIPAFNNGTLEIDKPFLMYKIKIKFDSTLHSKQGFLKEPLHPTICL